MQYILIDLKIFVSPNIKVSCLNIPTRASKHTKVFKHTVEKKSTRVYARSWLGFLCKLAPFFQRSAQAFLRLRTQRIALVHICAVGPWKIGATLISQFPTEYREPRLSTIGAGAAFDNTQLSTKTNARSIRRDANVLPNLIPYESDLCDPKDGVIKVYAKKSGCGLL